MLFRQVYQRPIAQASYLIGCQATGEALVIDPNRDLTQYLDLAAQEGLRITAVTETHIHADFVSGARELAARAGARLYLSGMGPTEWQYTYADEPNISLLRDGDSFRVGNIRIEAWHTPGHTPEHVAFVVTDAANADAPLGIATGDFVFVGDVGRPDLLEKAAGITGTMETGARQLFASLQRFRTLPEYVQVWPGHGAGSACGKALGAIPQSTVGYELRFNWAFQVQDEDTFVQHVLEGQPLPPRYFAQMKRTNKDGPAIGQPEPLVSLDTERLAAAQAAGALLLDVREPDEVARGHIPGSLNIAYGSSFLTWSGWLLPYDRPIVLVADADTAPRAASTLRLLGFDDVAGYITPTAMSTLFTAQVARLTPVEAASYIERTAIHVLDVRNEDERAEGSIAGSQFIPLRDLASRVADVPTALPVLVYCRSGVRSAIAAGILTARDTGRVLDLVGGMNAWHNAGLPEERA